MGTLKGADECNITLISANNRLFFGIIIAITFG